MTNDNENNFCNVKILNNKHNYLYYVKAKPEISDRDFDKLLAELINSKKKILNINHLIRLLKELVAPLQKPLKP